MGLTVDHLSPEAAEIASRDPELRTSFIRKKRWIGYRNAQVILRRMEDLLTHPPDSRMPNILLVGETNNGKTTLLERFAALHPQYEDGAGVHVPILIIEPTSPDESRFYTTILNATFSPHRPNDNIDKKRFQALSVLQAANVRILVIDELHTILAGPLAKQRQFLVTLKNLSNTLRIPIIAAGTRLANNAIQTDPQVSNRFHTEELVRWEFDDEFHQLLASFEFLLPLRHPSFLAENERLARHIYVLSEGIIGEVRRLLTLSALSAILHREECITIAVIDRVVAEGQWRTPTERRK